MAGTRIDPKAKERFAELHGLGCTQHESARAVGLHTPGKPVLAISDRSAVVYARIPDSLKRASSRSPGEQSVTDGR